MTEVALQVASSRGYSALPHQVVFHIPMEVAAIAFDVCRRTILRWAEDLQELGLLDFRAHKGSLRGGRVNTGTLWAVRLTGKAPKLTREDFQHPWRNLSQDVAHGRTAYKLMSQSQEVLLSYKCTELLLTWALPPALRTNPVNLTGTRLADQVAQLMDLPFIPKSDRRDAVKRFGMLICGYLGDQHPAMWYSLLWNLLRLADRGQNYMHTFYDLLRRAAADREEGFAKRPGALLLARLKQTPLWDLWRSVPPTRVA